MPMGIPATVGASGAAGAGAGAAAAGGGWGAIMSKASPYLMAGQLALSIADQAQKGRLADWENKLNAELTKYSWANKKGVPGHGGISSPDIGLSEPLLAALKGWESGAKQGDTNNEPLKKAADTISEDMEKASAPPPPPADAVAPGQQQFSQETQAPPAAMPMREQMPAPQQPQSPPALLPRVKKAPVKSTWNPKFNFKEY